MLALVNSDNPEGANQFALDVAVSVLLPHGHPYVIFLEHERCTHSDPSLDAFIGRPDETLAMVWMHAEDAALDTLPSTSDDTYLIWMGDN